MRRAGSGLGAGGFAVFDDSACMVRAAWRYSREFASHVGRSCPLPRELPFHKLLDWDAAAGRFACDLAYAGKQPDWTYPS